MAHAHRTALPHPAPHLSARDLYSTATPAFRRPDHLPRSPSFGAIRRHNALSPMSTQYGSLKMESGYHHHGSKTQPSIPPLISMTNCGQLVYSDGTPIKPEISGIIDKGFFIADNEWTCYRRNYFSCVCSFTLQPLLPQTPIQFQPNNSNQSYTVHGFAMCISAVVSDNESHTIELVQHTPKRDKGPIAKPDKIRLSPKPPQPHHPLSGIYDSGSLASSRYDPQTTSAPGSTALYGQSQQTSAPTEHTFERIQFKQATANNGKRRAAQQYYHLIVELWADIGIQQGSDPWIKVAYRKSAKMIVRGRSPGHYQSERRGSNSSGHGAGGAGGAGALGGAAPGGYGALLGPGDYTSSGLAPYGGSAYDPRSGAYTRHHHDLTMTGTDPMMSAEDVKSITEAKGYQYYASTIYENPAAEGHADTRHHTHSHHQPPQGQVELFSHSRNDTDSIGSTSGAAFDPTKIKPDPTPSSSTADTTSTLPASSASGPSSSLPSLFSSYNSSNGTSSSYYSASPAGQRCGRFESKPTSVGQYPGHHYGTGSVGVHHHHSGHHGAHHGGHHLPVIAAPGGGMSLT